MSQFFNSTIQRGELQELYEELNSVHFDIKKDAVKKVIANMTVGKDVSPLFQSVIKCLEHPEIELKKLVYLYIINYSRSKPDDAIMVINLFRKDVLKGTPLIKALAVRTMGCLRVAKLNEYLCDPLREALSDKDPYVRKTAVLCVPKVYEITPDLVDKGGFVQIMQKMLEKEGNALVMGNLVVTLQELSVMKKKKLMKITPDILQKLLIAVNECIEWGQVFILDCLVNYVPESESEAEIIIERITPRFSHINPAVVFSAIKVVVKYLDYLKNEELAKSIVKRINPSLATLISWENQPEVQYSILRNVGFILEKRPEILENDIKVFFVKFNDPYYIKIEKLHILIKLCNGNNFDAVLGELKEYTNEIDTQFVRKTISAIGSISVKYEKAVDKGINILMHLLRTLKDIKTHVIDEIMVAMEKIYRKHPNKWKFDFSLQEVSLHFGKVYEPKAKAAVYWIIGQFVEKFEKTENGLKFIESRMESFLEEQRVVQLQYLTAVVKIFLKYSETTEELITKLLQTATEQALNPDIRDRAYIYWRMLSTEPEKTRKIVLSDKPPMKEDVFKYDEKFLAAMLTNLAKVSTTFHKFPQDIYKNHLDDYITYFLVVKKKILFGLMKFKSDMTYEEERVEAKPIEEKSSTPMLKLKSPAGEKTVSKVNDLLETEEKPKAVSENKNYLFDLIDIQDEKKEKLGDLIDFGTETSVSKPSVTQDLARFEAKGGKNDLFKEKRIEIKRKYRKINIFNFFGYFWGERGLNNSPIKFIAVLVSS